MDKNLEDFKKNNPLVEIKEEMEHINIENSWCDRTFMLRFPKDQDFSAIGDIELPIEFSAIYHKAAQKLEFIFAPLPETDVFLNRKASFYYKGHSYKTEFTEPSETLILLAKGFKEVESRSDSLHRNLREFRDYYQDEQTEQTKSYYKDKKPYCFFISGNIKKIKDELVEFCKHLNVYLKFFDRKSPTVHIIDTEQLMEDEFKMPCKTEDSDYPDTIAMSSIDPVAVDLLQVAMETGSSRLKYIFYYQILEYFAYYYLDEELKRKFTNLLKNPDILNNPGNYSKIIIEELKDFTNNTSDRQKLTKLVSDYLIVEDIKSEITNNAKFFVKDVEFDGGFTMQALIKDENIFDQLEFVPKETKDKKKEKERKKQELIASISDRIERIRNVLVHIRESRENKVIYPTKKNHQKLLPYLYLMRRISEVISMKYNV